jgi:hypothetical protein
MYYVIGDGIVLEMFDSLPYSDEELPDLADEYAVDEIWVIRGEHIGLSWERPSPRPESAPQSRIVFGQKETYPA